MALSAESYARQLTQLLPPGRLWLTEPDSVLSQVMLALSEELARVDARGDVLVSEGDPSTATETLPDWERMLALPDDAVQVVPGTDAERRLAVVSKLLRRGGQNASFYVDLAAACGYSATVTEGFGLTVARADRSRADSEDRDEQWAHAWQMNVSPPTGAALSHDELERIIRRASPIHTYVFFVYL